MLDKGRRLRRFCKQRYKTISICPAGAFYFFGNKTVFKPEVISGFGQAVAYNFSYILDTDIFLAQFFGHILCHAVFLPVEIFFFPVIHS